MFKIRLIGPYNCCCRKYYKVLDIFNVIDLTLDYSEQCIVRIQLIMMRIGALAKRTGLSVTALRYYEKRGLLLDGPRTIGGYREYDERDVDRIAALVAAKRLGFTLQEIAQILDAAEDPSIDHVVAKLVAARLSAVRREIRDLTKLENKLASRLEEWSKKSSAKRDPLWLIMGDIQSD